MTWQSKSRQINGLDELECWLRLVAEIFIHKNFS